MSRTLKIAGVIELVVAAGIVCFWIAFFSTDLLRITDPELRQVYYAFEAAFPLPDAWLVLTLIAGGVGLLKGRPYGLVLSLIAGGLLVFLGLLDFSFNAHHGIYGVGVAEAFATAALNLLCLGAGVTLIATVWKHLGASLGKPTLP